MDIKIENLYSVIKKAILKDDRNLFCKLLKGCHDPHKILPELVGIINKACNNKLNCFDVVDEHNFTISCNIDEMLFKTNITMEPDNCNILLNIQECDCPMLLSSKITLASQEFINYLFAVKANIDLYLQD